MFLLRFIWVFVRVWLPKTHSVPLLDRPKVTRLLVRNSTIEFRHITPYRPRVHPPDWRKITSLAKRGNDGSFRRHRRAAERRQVHAAQRAKARELECAATVAFVVPHGPELGARPGNRGDTGNDVGQQGRIAESSGLRTGLSRCLRRSEQRGDDERSQQPQP